MRVAAWFCRFIVQTAKFELVFRPVFEVLRTGFYAGIEAVFVMPDDYPNNSGAAERGARRADEIRAAMPGASRSGAASGSGQSGGESTWARDQAVELLNGAKLSTDAAAKSTHLKQLAELVIRKDPSLLGEFLEPLLELQVDPAAAVRKTLVSLCEEIATGNPQHLARCIATLRALLKDAAPAVVKQAAKASGPVFREALIEAATKGEGPRVPKEVTDMWTAAKALKDDVRRLVLADRVNDGVRMQAVKFLELAVVLFHGREWGAGIVRDGHATVSLDALATEADDLMGVLLECLKPETMQIAGGDGDAGHDRRGDVGDGQAADIHRFRAAGAAGTRGGERGGGRGGRQERRHRVHGQGLRSTLLNALKSSGERNEIAEYKS